MVRRLALTAVVIAIVGSVAPAVLADGGWLDEQPLVQWNQPSMAIPVADAASSDFFGDPRCVDTTRPAETDEDQQAAAAGWYLVGAYRAGWGVKVVTVTSAFDGMCRPVGFQVLVFKGGMFAGTISPVLMNSRFDGAAGEVSLSSFGGISLSTSFARYSDTDPLCCPSRTTYASYRIDDEDGAPVLHIVSASTSPTSRN